MEWERQKEKGQSVVELALILPIIIVLLAITFDFGRALLYYADVFHAAREGAWIASERPWDTGGVQRAVVNVLLDSGMDPARGSVEVRREPGYRVRVTVRYVYDPVLPLPVTRISLVASHTMRLRR